MGVIGQVILVGRAFLARRIIGDLIPCTSSEIFVGQPFWSLVETCVSPSERMDSLGNCFRI